MGVSTAQRAVHAARFNVILLRNLYIVTDIDSSILVDLVVVYIRTLLLAKYSAVGNSIENFNFKIEYFVKKAVSPGTHSAVTAEMCLCNFLYGASRLTFISCCS